MKLITKIAVVENATAIWEYNPSLEGNRVLGGLLDAIAAIRTLAIKVCIKIIHRSHLLPFRDKIQASGQRIEYFESTQLRCGLEVPLKIPLHSNIRWGTAFKMLDQSHKLRQVSNQILSSFSYLQVDVIIADRILSCICRRDVWSNHHITPRQSHRQKYTMVGIQIDGYRLDPSR